MKQQALPQKESGELESILLSIYIRKIFCLLIFLNLGFNLFGQTNKVEYCPVLANYTYTKSNNIYSANVLPHIVGYETNTDYTHRKALSFNLGNITSNSTIDSCEITFYSGEQSGSSDGSLIFTKLDYSFPTKQPNEVYDLIGSGIKLDTLEIDALKNYISSLDSLVQDIQNSIESQYPYLGVGIFNRYESSGYGTSVSGVGLTVYYTKPTPPAPINLTTQSVTATSLILSWTPVPGNVSGYKVFLNNNLYTSTTNTNVTIIGLCPSVIYNLKVVAFNSFGDGESSQTKQQMTIPTTIVGTSTLCSSGSSYSVIDLPTDGTFTWDKSQSIDKVTSGISANPCVFRANGMGPGWIKAIVTSTGCGSKVVNYDLWTGVPDAPVVSPGTIINTPINTVFFITINDSPGASPNSGYWEPYNCVTLNSPNYGQTASFISSSVDGTGTVYVSNSNVCGSYYKTMITIVTGQGGDCNGGILPESIEDPILFLSPNPTSEYIDIKINLNIDDAPINGILKIYDSYARTVRNLRISEYYHRISLQDLNSGTYILTVEFDEIKAQEKFIIKR